jgi:CubicO group peptidase (beta-lactamase class C family)
MDADSSVSGDLAFDAMALTAWLETKRVQLNLPGIACAIVQADQIVYTHGCGFARPGRPVTSQTPFILGSLSKSFTALAIQQLAESELLDLDACVTEYLPWFTMADERAKAITLRQLLLHTSGISRFTGRAFLSRPTSQRLEQVVRALFSVKLVHAPGERFEYSNTNYAILSLLIETLSGMSYADYVQTYIFYPLGMGHSHISLAEAQADGLAQGYQWWWGCPIPVSAPYLLDAQGAAFLISSAQDMGRWLQLHLHGQVDGVSLVSQSGLDELHRPDVPTGKGMMAALGWRVGQLAGETTWQHGGEVSNFRSDMILLPGRGIGVVVLANCNHGLIAQLGLDQVAHDIARFLLVGQPPLQRRMTPRSFGFMVASGSLLLLILATLLWATLVGASSVSPGGIVAVLIALVVPWLALWKLPKVGDMPWKGLRLYVSDIAYQLQGLLIISTLLALFTLLRWVF